MIDLGCLYTLLLSHRSFSRRVTVLVVAASIFPAYYVARRMRNGTIRDVARCASTTGKCYKIKTPREVAFRLKCGDLSDSTGHV